MDSKGVDSTSDPMEVDSVPDCQSGEKIDGNSRNVSVEKINGGNNMVSVDEMIHGGFSAVKANGDSSVKTSLGDASETKEPISRGDILAEEINTYKELSRAGKEAEKGERAAPGGQFKVPRFSSKNPPPHTESESSKNIQVVPPPPEVFSEVEPSLGVSHVRQSPEKKEVIWRMPPPRVFPECSEVEEADRRRDEANYTALVEKKPRNASSENEGQVEKKRRLVDKEVTSDTGTTSEGAVDPAVSEAESGVSNVPERKSGGADLGNSERHDESGNSVNLALGSERADNHPAVEPRAEVGTTAGGFADFKRVSGNSGATDLATVYKSGVAPSGGQPGSEGDTLSKEKLASVDRVNTGVPPYVKPSWSAPPNHPFQMEILKGVSLGIVDVSEKGAYMFGRSDRCDFVLEHPTISRFHAVLQYNSKGKAFIFDLGSSHGTFINKQQVQGKTYTPLNVGDIVRFGLSTRLYHFQGPTEFMPVEGLSKSERHAIRMLELAQEKAEREQSLLRASRNTASADGATWGMQEDAVEEEEEEDSEEITWQNFKGELTDKQQKTLEKVHKRQEKLANLKKENDAIQAKEISQGGLTQGQQTQIARNEQRMAQLVEELENMEETLNESIREAILGRSGIRIGGKKSSLQNEDDEDLSDDEFYDRTSKLKEKRRKKEASQVVETAETLLEKKSSLSKEIESVRLLMEAEHEQSKQKEVVKKDAESVDPLDKFMTSISTSIEQDRTARLQKELDSVTKELARIERLLKIADPTGDALKKWQLKQIPESLTATVDLAHKIDKRLFSRKDDAKELASSIDGENDATSNSATQEQTTDTKEDSEKTLDLRPLDPPIRLGAPVTKEESEEKSADLYHRESESAAGFINYKDRKKDMDEINKDRSTLKVAASSNNESREEATEADKDVASSVALLLKHKRDLADRDMETSETTVTASGSSQELLKKKKKKKKKKIFGPAKPSYMTNAEEEESWVPPAGQSGDGRTALNDKYGY